MISTYNPHRGTEYGLPVYLVYPVCFINNMKQSKTKSNKVCYFKTGKYCVRISKGNRGGRIPGTFHGNKYSRPICQYRNYNLQCRHCKKKHEQLQEEVNLIGDEGR